MANLFVVITDKGTPVEKRVYSGDVSGVVNELNKEAAANPSFGFLVFPDEKDVGFEKAPLPPTLPATQDQLKAIFIGGQDFEDMKAKVLSQTLGQGIAPKL